MGEVDNKFVIVWFRPSCPINYSHSFSLLRRLGNENRNQIDNENIIIMPKITRYLVSLNTVEPCDLPCLASNLLAAANAAGGGGAGGGLGNGGGGNQGGRGSSPSVSGVAAPSPSPSHSHSSPYDLRRKSPPHPDPAPGTSSALPPAGGSSISAALGSSSLPARKRPRRTCSLSTDGTLMAIHHMKLLSFVPLEKLQCRFLFHFCWKEKINGQYVAFAEIVNTSCEIGA